MLKRTYTYTYAWHIRGLIKQTEKRSDRQREGRAQLNEQALHHQQEMSFFVKIVYEFIVPTTGRTAGAKDLIIDKLSKRKITSI